MATVPEIEEVTIEDHLGEEDEYVPEGWETQSEFLEDARKRFIDDIEYDRENRDAALEDLKFTAGDQWDPEIRQAREENMRPCMTINVLPQFVGQVIGDRRLNKTSIKVRPFRDGTQAVADVRSGLIKSIEMYSRAERVYDAACEDQVICGISNMRVDLDYATNDVFDQDIFIRHIPNPLAVVWDRMSVDPTGRDAQHCFVIDRIPTKEYEKRFPEHPIPTGFTDDALNGETSWIDGETVQLCEFWEMIEKPATFAMMADGDIKDVTDMEQEEYWDQLWFDPATVEIDEMTGEPIPGTGEPRIRDSYRTYARMHLVTSFAVLEEGYELPLDRLPIIRVEGRVTRVGDDRVRFGLVRNAKDSQRMKNYWRSATVETISLAPKAVWAGPSDAFEGRVESFRRAHLSNEPLIWNKNASAAPERLDPPAIPSAMLQEAQFNQQDIKDTTGLHDASLGMRSNEVSGKAIEARQAQGNVATVIYHDNLNHAIQEVGDVVNQLIPLAYDTTRTVRIIGEDDEHKLQTINDPNDEEMPDITKGRYDVALETGPSFSTQRKEALEAMMQLLQTSPDMMGIMGDLVAKYMDWPGAYEIHQRLRKMPSIQQFLDDEETESGEEGQPSPEELMQLQMMQQQMQAQEEAMQAEQQARQLALAEQQAKAAQAAADARTAEANARAAEAKADEAEAKAVIAAVEARHAPELAAAKIRLAERPAPAKSSDNPRGARRRPTKGSTPRKEQGQ